MVNIAFLHKLLEYMYIEIYKRSCIVFFTTDHSLKICCILLHSRKYAFGLLLCGNTLSKKKYTRSKTSGTLYSCNRLYIYVLQFFLTLRVTIFRCRKRNIKRKEMKQFFLFIVEGLKTFCKFSLIWNITISLSVCFFVKSIHNL